MPTPADPSAGSGGASPAAAHAQDCRTGHDAHRGRRRRHTVPPSSMIAWFQAHAPPGGTSSSARAWASAAGSGRPSQRANTLPTLVSTTPTSSLESERQYRASRVGTDTGQGAQGRQVRRQRAAVVMDHCPGAAVQVDRPPVVAEPDPEPEHLAERRRRARRRRREAVQEPLVVGDDPVDPRLLRHDLGDEHRPRVAGAAPGQVAEVYLTPGEHQVLPVSRHRAR